MKRLISIALLMLCSLICSSQYNVMYVHRKSGCQLKVPISNIDSIYFVKNDDLSNSDSTYLTIDEAASLPMVIDAAATLRKKTGNSPEFTGVYKPPYTSIEPIQLFDNLYFVGTTAVGSFIIDTGDGLVMLDTGCGETDVKMMVSDMKKLGLDPSKIKLILISHEHFDHYGGVLYLTKNVCSDAKVAMSLIGWNMLQSVPMESAFWGTRPQKVDVYLIDGMKIKVGNVMFQVVSTPGHSPGCVSFIIPVKDNGESHFAGIMGGLGVPSSQVEARLYKSSIEYFKAYAVAKKCDVGLYIHSKESYFKKLRERKYGEANPLIIGCDKFNSVYLEDYRSLYKAFIAQQ